MSEPSSPNTCPAPAPALPKHQFQLDDLQWLRACKDSQPEPTTWDQRMHALAKHRGLQREKLPAEPPSRLN